MLRVVRVLATAVLVTCRVVAGAQMPGESIEYYAIDAVGSVRVVFDASGIVVARLDYEPFGREVSVSSAAVDRKFAGLFRDGES
jgi:hypothetical protein